MKARQLTLALLLPTALTIACNDSAERRIPTESSSPSMDQGRRNEGSGSQFRTIGDAEITRDPENPTNTVLKVTSDGATPAGVKRDLRNVQLWQLDHQLNFKWAFVAPHSCAGGSPRVILLIDANGDGRFRTASEGGPDFAANGHIRPPAFAGCETAPVTPNDGGPAPSSLLWRFDDVTDEQARWEITGGVVPGFPPFPGPNWDAMEQLISTAFPNHRVLQVRLLEDFNPTPPGVSYYDLITVFDLTLGTRGQWEPQGHENRED
jgi:hypothetical protein